MIRDTGELPVQYIDWGVGYTSLYICQSSSNYTFKMCAFQCMYLSSRILKTRNEGDC